MEAHIQLFGAGLEVSFPRRIAYTQGAFDAVGDKLDAVAGFRLRSDQVRVRHTDILYNYEMSARFFGDNATFFRDADRMTITLMNGRLKSDFELIANVLNRFCAEFLSGTEMSAWFTANAHASFETIEQRDGFLARFAPSTDVVAPAVLGSVKTDEWPEHVRVQIEASYVVPNAVYLSWGTVLPPLNDWREALEKIVKACESAARVYGVELKALLT